jgi:formate dehydrogenase alpha subunit
LPAGFEVKAALERLNLLICQDPFLTETAQHAHYVLPACTYAEKEGTFTNLEGRVLRFRKTMEPVGDSLPDWHIMTAIASGLGASFEYESNQDIQNEIMKLLPGYYNLGQPRKVYPNADAYLADGYPNEVGNRYRTVAHGPDEGTLGLAMGQLLYHSGKLSTQAAGLLRISPNPYRLMMNSQDMARLALKTGDRARIENAQGALDIDVQEDPSVLPGSCFFPEHFNEPAIKDLMPVEVDPTTGVPYFKLAWVTIRAVPRGGEAPS